MSITSSCGELLQDVGVHSGSVLTHTSYSTKPNTSPTEQANAIFTSILHTEVTPPSPRRPVSPQRPTTSSSASTAHPPSTPTRKHIFHYTLPATSANPSTPTRRLDTPTDEVYSTSPVRVESRQLLESSRRQLRNVCKTPYHVLDAPDLADDLYLNLVDWSSTNVLGVGPGSCVYLWMAHNAAVSKLCDLTSSDDIVSSVSWVQKVYLVLSVSSILPQSILFQGMMVAFGTLSGRMHIYDAHTPIYDTHY